MPLPILYSFRRCPYAIRARMAIAYAYIDYELREVSLKNKPQQMLDISPKGTTPVMQIFSDRGSIVLEESLDIMNWALQQRDPAGWLDLDDSQKEITQQLININDSTFKKSLDQYKYPNRFPDHPQEFYRQQGEIFLQVLEDQLRENHHFLICDRQTIVDVAIFPFIRQFAYVDTDWFQGSVYTHLQQWLQWHEASNLFEVVMQKFPVWNPQKFQSATNSWIGRE